jgi:YidC/Oxa1 family membrane protein insertase
MNKNLVTFIVSAVLIWVGSIWLQNKYYPHLAEDRAKAFQSASAGRAASSALPAPSGAPAGAAAVAFSSPPAKVPLQESLITVTTDSTEVVLSNVGAKIKSLKLLAYKEHPGQPEPVQLIPGAGNYGALSITGAALEEEAWTLETAKPVLGADGLTRVAYRISIPGTPFTFRKTFGFEKHDFVIHVTVDVVNAGSVDQSFLKSYLLWGPSIGMPEQGRQAAAAAGGAVQWLRDGTENRLDRVSPGDTKVYDYQNPKWIAIKNHYFVAAYINDGGFPEAQLRRETLSSVSRTVTSALGLGEFIVKAGETKSFSTRLYAGPQDYEALKAFHNNLSAVVQFSFQWLSPLSVFLLSVMRFFESLTHNWGFAVILLTVFVKLALFYPTHRGMASSRRMQTQMAKMAPVLESLKKTYKDDPAKLQQETMRLYKEHGVNPHSGCFLMLPQMFIMISLYGALNGAFELRGASFIGPWTDLSAPDPTFILVPLMGASMWLQQKLAPTAAAGASEDQAQMQKMMTTMMPIMFTVMGFIFRWPTGLLLYWSVSNVFGVAQQWYVNKTVK